MVDLLGQQLGECSWAWAGQSDAKNNAVDERLMKKAPAGSQVGDPQDRPGDGGSSMTDRHRVRMVPRSGGEGDTPSRCRGRRTTHVGTIVPLVQVALGTRTANLRSQHPDIVGVGSRARAGQGGKPVTHGVASWGPPEAGAQVVWKDTVSP